jgi:endonuclease I
MKTKHTTILFLLVCSLLLVGCQNPSPSTSENSASINSGTEIINDTSTSTTTSTSVESGTVYPNAENPNAKVTTVQALAQKKATDKTTLYRVTGTAQYAGYYKKGYFDLVDNGWTIVAYGISATSSCISKSGSNYTYTNNDSFGSTGIKAGDTITIEGIFTFYAYSSSYGVPEFSGYPTKIVKNGLSGISAGTYTASETYTGDYYKDVTDSDSGTALGLKLHDLMMDTHKTYVSYSSLDSTLKQTDNGCFYSNESISSFNKEHVWPQAKSKDGGSNQLFGESYAGSDIHHIRASKSTYNSYRGSSLFATIFGTPRTVKYNGTNEVVKFGSGNNYGVTEPADSRKGDVARIIMYVYTHYGTDFGGKTTTGITGKLYITNVIGANSQSDCYKLLRKWSAMDPVSAEERNRNEIAYQKQGNRNPFIDHPSYADRIWPNN